MGHPVGEGGVAVNCEKTQFFLNTLYFNFRVERCIERRRPHLFIHNNKAELVDIKEVSDE